VPSHFCISRKMRVGVWVLPDEFIGLPTVLKLCWWKEKKTEGEGPSGRNDLSFLADYCADYD